MARAPAGAWPAAGVAAPRQARGSRPVPIPEPRDCGWRAPRGSRGDQELGLWALSMSAHGAQAERREWSGGADRHAMEARVNWSCGRDGVSPTGRWCGHGRMRRGRHQFVVHGRIPAQAVDHADNCPDHDHRGSERRRRPCRLLRGVDQGGRAPEGGCGGSERGHRQPADHRQPGDDRCDQRGQPVNRRHEDPPGTPLERAPTGGPGPGRPPFALLRLPWIRELRHPAGA